MINIEIDLDTLDTPKEIIGHPISFYTNYYVAYDYVNDIELYVIMYDQGKMYMVATTADDKKTILNPKEI